jgi:signal transduction histidine kinase
MYKEMGLNDEAIFHLGKAVDVAIEMGNSEFIQESRDNLYMAYAEASNFKNAYETLVKSKLFSDSLTNIKRERALAELENQLELDRQNKVNRLLTEKQQQQENQLHTQYILIIVGVFVIFLVVFVLIMMRKSAREREVINAQLQKQKLELEEVNNAKDKLFALIAHDLRSPLTSMQGVLSLIKDNALTMQEIKELIPELELSVQKNVDVMEDLLAWAKEQLSGVKIDIKLINVYDVVSKIVSSQSFLASKKGVSIDHRVPKDEMVMADHDALQLVVRNVISNGIKFTEDGGEIIISVEENSTHTQLMIKDTGIGIPRDVADKIFESKTWSRKGTNKEKGSGFGLSLSKEFVEKMNGRIWFESKEGEGSTFYIELPKA